MELIARIREFVSGLSRARRLRHGLNAVILTVAVLGILVMINVVAGDFRLRADVTRSQQHSLSELTRQVIASVDRPVKITAFIQEGGPFSARIRDLLDEYAHNSRFISVEYIDPERDPSQARVYGVQTLDTTVFECEDRVRHVPLREAFTVDQSIGLIDFTGEQAFTQALMAVLRVEERFVYFIEGHGEASQYEGMRHFGHGLMLEGFTARTLNLSRVDLIPDDAEVIVLAGPERDYAPGEVDMLIEWFRDGGRLLAMIDPSIKKGDLPNVKRLIAELGVQLDDSLVVDPARSYILDLFSPIPYLEYHAITDSLIRNNLSVVLPYARSLRPLDGYEGELNVRRLLWSSNEAWGETDLGGRVDRDEDDFDPPLWMGVVVTEDTECPLDHDHEHSPCEDQLPRALVIGNSSLASDEVIEFQGNLDLVLNSVNFLAGDEEKIAIRPKNPEFNRVFMSGDQARTMFYSSVFVLPGLVLVAGIIIWLRRRTL